MLATTANALVRALLAPACAACRTRLDRPLDGPVCYACWLAIPRLTPPLCDCCGDALASDVLVRLCPRCLRAPPGFEAARSAGRYEGSLRALVHAFKYERRRMLAAPLARLLVRAGADVLGDADAVVPVPLHPWRSFQRGFNQADDLAQRIGPPVWRALRRIRRGPPQVTLPAAGRRANVDRAFGPSARLSLAPGDRLRDRLQHKTVVLVDDVMTTGATLDACSRVLLDAGVRSVRALTVARAVVPMHAPPRLRHHPWVDPRR
jgi:ComF family protein